MAKTKAQKASYLDPERLYALEGFYSVSGISQTRRYEAHKAGIELPTLIVGKRKFVRGVDAIAFIERLAENPEAN